MTPKEIEHVLIELNYNYQQLGSKFCWIGSYWITKDRKGTHLVEDSAVAANPKNILQSLKELGQIK